MKLDKEFFLKNRFWVLLAGAFGLWVVGLAVVLIGPAATAAKARAAVAQDEKNFKGSADVKNESFLTSWNERKEFYNRHKNTVWGAAWNTQNNLMSWPEGKLTREYGNKYFGDPIDSLDIKAYQERDYKTQFVDNDGKVSRQAFLGGEYLPIAFDDKAILNPHDFSKPKTGDSNVVQPSSEEVWLAQEEVWVRRELLLVLNEALETIGKFTEVRERDWDRSPASLLAAGGSAFDAAWRRNAGLYKKRPLTEQQQKEGLVASRLFKNYNWQVELLIKREGNKTFVSPDSTIMNVNTDGRALSLVNAAGRGLLLQLRQGKSHPFLTRISGRLLQPGEWVPFGKTTSIDSIDFVKGELELYEVFEPLTSPIRRLEDIRIGKAALAHRHNVAAELVPPRFAAAPPSQPNAGGGGASGGGVMGAMGGGPPGGGTAGMSGPPAAGMGGMGQGGGSGQGGAAASTMTPYGLDRNRYVLCTETVRRLPVALVVSMDQAHRNALLTAIANSRLRLQTTQIYWRHRDPVQVASGGYRPPDAGGLGGAAPGLGGMGSAGGPPPMGGGSSSRDGPPKPPAGGGSAGAGTGPQGGESHGKEAAEGDTESGRNLIELTIHGVASLFERFPPREATQPGQPGAPGTPGMQPPKP